MYSQFVAYSVQFELRRVDVLFGCYVVAHVHGGGVKH